MEVLDLDILTESLQEHYLDGHLALQVAWGQVPEGALTELVLPGIGPNAPITRVVLYLTPGLNTAPAAFVYDALAAELELFVQRCQTLTSGGGHA